MGVEGMEFGGWEQARGQEKEARLSREQNARDWEGRVEGGAGVQGRGSPAGAAGCLSPVPVRTELGTMSSSSQSDHVLSTTVFIATNCPQVGGEE